MERQRAHHDVEPSSEGTVSIVSVSDDRAGNMRQADALANALGSAHALILQPRWPWRAFAPRCIPGGERAFGQEFRRMLDAAPAVSVGCGRQAALATRLLRARGSRAVQILDPRIDPGHWDVVVAPRHDALRGRTVIASLGSLHPVDDLWLARARAQFAAFEALPRPRTALLVGGSSRHVMFDRNAFDALATHVDAALARDGGSLLATASRRTEPDVRRALRERFPNTPGVAWVDAQDGANPYPGLLAWADRIVCSPDSVNMISEACATTVPVYVSAPHGARGRLRTFLDSLLAIGRIRVVDAVLAPFDVEPLRETARIAEEVRTRLSLR
jgi:mitochondrial fission protein ELM1